MIISKESRFLQLEFTIPILLYKISSDKMLRPNLTHSNYRYFFVYKFNQNINGNSNIFRVKIAFIRSSLVVLAISANIADVKFYHNTVAVIGPHSKETVAGILSVDSFYVR